MVQKNFIVEVMEKYPPFQTIEEERKMISSYLEKNDREGMLNELVSRNIGLLATFARKLDGYSGCSYEDIVAVGIEILYHAADKFDVERGTKFSSFAMTILKRDIVKTMIKNFGEVAMTSISSDKKIKSDDDDGNLGDYLYGMIDKTDRHSENVQFGKYLSWNEQETLDNIFRHIKRKLTRSQKMKVEFARRVIFSDDNVPYTEILTRMNNGIPPNCSRQRVGQMYRMGLSLIKKSLHEISMRNMYGNKPGGSFEKRIYDCFRNESKRSFLDRILKRD